MKHYIKILAAVALTLLLASSQKTEEPSLYKKTFVLNTIDGKPFNLGAFEGKKLLLVNTASECGYTSQYEALQQLSEKYKNDLVVVGLPCNQFGNQEPGSAEEIQTFCKKNFGVTFPLTEKINVKGSDQHPLYNWLTNKSLNGLKDSEVRWNFQKYLIDEKGHLIQVYSSSTDPLSEAIISSI